MRKMITCSFDDNGVIMTAWNGVHPDRPGHFSVTKAISRFDYNEACQDRKLFGLILGIDITQGWQNALMDAIKNASDLKIDAKKTVDFLVKLLVAKYGEEKAKAIFEAAEKENADIEAALRAELEKQAEPVTDETPAAKGEPEPESSANTDTSTPAENAKPVTDETPAAKAPAETKEEENGRPDDTTTGGKSSKKPGGKAATGTSTESSASGTK